MRRVEWNRLGVHNTEAEHMTTASIFIAELRAASHVCALARQGITDTVEVSRRTRLPISEVMTWNKLLRLGLIAPDNRPKHCYNSRLL